MAETSQWNRPKAANAAASSKGSAYSNRGGRPFARGLLAALVVVVGGVLAFYFVCGRQETAAPAGTSRPTTERKRGKIAEVAPAKVAKPKAAPKAKAAKPADPALKIPEGMVAVTNAGKVIFMTPKEAETFRRACRDTTLRTQTEKRLRLLASVPVGLPVPPMPGSLDMDADWEATLKNEIKILPDDTEREIEQKKFVMAFKEYMAEEIADGKTANQVYEEYVQRMNKVAQLTTAGSQMARELEAEGDREGVRRFVEALNEKIEELGGDPIDLHRRPRGRTAPGPGPR